MAASCIVCLIGLPASGKTTFSLRLKDRLKHDIKNVKVLIVALDSIITVEDQKKLVQRKKCDQSSGLSDAESENEDWKRIRQNIIAAVDNLLAQPITSSKCSLECVDEIMHQILHSNEFIHGEPTDSEEYIKIFIMDDNLYYRSMRYEYFQLARKHKSGFAEIYMRCSMATAMKRNKTRNCVVPDEVISNMACRLEEPAPTKWNWEENTIIIDSEKEFTEQDISLSVDAVVQSLNHPYQPVEDDSVEKEQSRMITSRNVLHQIDTTLRRLTSRIIKEHKDQQESGNGKCGVKQFSVHVNAVRTRLLDDIRKGLVKFPDEFLNLLELEQLEQRREEVSSVLMTMLMKRIYDEDKP